MPDLGIWHPQIVHFVVALTVVGVAARVISLLLPRGRASFVGPMAATLILAAAAASVPAKISGTQAHGPAERVPGAREQVVKHEDAGILARNLLLALAAVELIGLFLRGKPAAAKGANVLAAAIGLWALYGVYRAGDEGGKLVYGYAGGVGVRSGSDSDLRNLLTAGLYHNAVKARDVGRKEDAARWIDELARSRPGDPEVKLLVIESKLVDRADPRGALDALAALEAPAANSRLAVRRASLAARAYAAVGQPDSGRVILETLKREHPDDRRVREGVERALQQISR